MRIDSATGINSALTGSFSGSFIGDGTNLTGVAATSFNLDSLDALGGATIDQADNLLFSDAGTEKKVTFSNFEDTIFGNVSGDGTIAAGGALTLADGNSTRTNLGLAIGTDVQAYDAQLADVAGLAVTDGGFIVGDGSNFVLETGATARASLGLTIGTHVQAYDAQLTDVAGLAVTDGGFIVGDGSNFVLETGATARASLGLTIGTHVQAYDAQLADVAGLAVTDGGIIVGDGSNFVLETGATARTSLGLGTGDSPTFTGLTLSGDLTVNGTTTTVNSNTLNIGDNIIALNGVGSTLGGIAVNDANSASGSLLWDGANNYWIAGATGSEGQVLTTGNVDSDILTFSLPASTTISAFGKTLVDDADAAAARTTLGVGTIGTLSTVDISDNTNLAAGTGVTLTGDTLSIGQAVATDDDVTFNKVVATTHVSASSYSGSSYLGGIFGNAVNDEYFDFQTDAQVDLKIDDVVDFRFLDGGTFHANSDIIAYSTTIASDERLKENITDTEHGLDTVLSLEAKEFDWIEKNGGKHDIGFIAQQVQEVLPVLVKEVEGLNGEDAHLTVNYTQLIPVLVNAIKELNAKVEELSK